MNLYPRKKKKKKKKKKDSEKKSRTYVNRSPMNNPLLNKRILYKFTMKGSKYFLSDVTPFQKVGKTHAIHFP